MHRRWHKENKSRSQFLIRRWHLKKKYKITPKKYTKMLKKQKYRCSICKTKNNGKRRFVVEHDHRTNKVRSLSCNRCNAILGMAGDNIKLLKNAIKYLRKFKK